MPSTVIGSSSGESFLSSGMVTDRRAVPEFMPSETSSWKASVTGSDAPPDPMVDMRCRSCGIIIGPAQETVFSPICWHLYRAEYMDAVAARGAWDCQFVVDVLRVQGVVSLGDFAFLAPDGVCIHAARHQGAAPGGFFSGPLIVAVLLLSKHMVSASVSYNSIYPYL